MSDLKFLGDLKYSQSENTFIIEHFNKPYLEVLELQNNLNTFVYENPQYRFFIFTSHEECLTMGRGLRENDIKKYELIEDSMDDLVKSDLQIHQIKRGGGMTFHHSGQLVIYPILSITKEKKSSLELMDWLFQIIIDAVYELTDIKLEIRHDLLGLWYGDKKVCSMGIELNRYVTKHGLALNLSFEKELTDKLKSIHPCGLSFSKYQSLELTDKDQLISSVIQRLVY